MRFIAVILDPGRVWSDHAVIDTKRQVRICTCSHGDDADTIAKVLNLRWIERGGMREKIPMLPESFSPSWSELDEAIVAKGGGHD